VRRATEQPLKAARFPANKTLDTFDFEMRHSINKSLVLELARGDYLDQREIIEPFRVAKEFEFER